MTQHLTEEEFSDYLLGLSTSTARTHLLECAHCREEMEIFGASMSAFNQLSLSWSREQAAAQPVRIQPQTAAGRKLTGVSPVRNAGWAAGLAAAAVLAFAVALPMALMHQHVTHTNVASTAAPAAAPAPAMPAADSDIAEDNQMMAAIDAEISQPELSPVESFATFRPQHTASHDGRPAIRKKS